MNGPEPISPGTERNAQLDADLAQRPAPAVQPWRPVAPEWEHLKAAINCVMQSVWRHPHTDSGLVLRRFLWSMWTGGQFVNLNRLSYVLDDQHSEAVAVIFTAFVLGCYREDLQRQVLEKSGEFKRLEEAQKKARGGRACDYPPLPDALAERIGKKVAA